MGIQSDKSDFWKERTSLNTSKSFDTMVCLVGENPLPIYLGIRQLAAPNARIVLVHSSETGKVAKPIATKMKELGYQAEMRKLTDPYAPMKVLEDIRKIAEQFPGAVLNYTGGTKVMSTFAVLAWKQDAKFENSFYLEEGGGDSDLGQFHFSDGSVPVELDVELTLNDLCALHKVTPKDPNTYPPYCFQDLLNLWLEVELKRMEEYFDLPARFKDKQQYNDLLKQYSHQTKEWSTGGYWQRFLEILDVETRAKWLQEEIPGRYNDYKQDYHPNKPPHCVSEFCKQVEFVRGTWMEAFIVELLLSLEKDPIESFVYGADPATPLVQAILAGQEFTYREQFFEADLTLVVNHCLRYISVTTSDSLKTCRGKVFEAMHRSQQIGGGMARSCVISLLNAEDIGKCRASIGTARHTIFGHDDITAWMNTSRLSLYSFLTK
jgi:hypothetical protein